MIRFLLLLILALHVQLNFSMINPFYKEVIQRGYEIMPGDSVRFPDGSICSISAFNAHECGEDWMTNDYCIPQGRAVWDDNRCCEGLAPYLEEGVDGQATCQETTSEKEGFLSYFSSSTVLYFFIGVLIPLGLFVILAISVKKRLPKKEE